MVMLFLPKRTCSACKPSRSRSGFALVEVIVAAVLMAILAAVAIPMYNNYIANQRQTNVDNLAKTGAISANAFFRKTNTHPTVAQLNLFFSEAGRYSVAINTGARTVTVTDNGVSPAVVSAAANY